VILTNLKKFLLHSLISMLIGPLLPSSSTEVVYYWISTVKWYLVKYPV